MSPEEFAKALADNAEGIRRLFERDLPVKVGNIAVRHFGENFRKGGFVDGGLHRWQRSKRIGTARGSAGTRGTLIGEAGNMMKSTRSKPRPHSVTITNNTPYARVHNEGLRAGRGRGFQMPRRQFIGESRELNQKVQATIENAVMAELGGE